MRSITVGVANALLVTRWRLWVMAKFSAVWVFWIRWKFICFAWCVFRRWWWSRSMLWRAKTFSFFFGTNCTSFIIMIIFFLFLPLNVIYFIWHSQNCPFLCFRSLPNYFCFLICFYLIRMRLLLLFSYSFLCWFDFLGISYVLRGG